MIHSRMILARTMRTLGGILIACMLVLSVLAPAVDAYICIADAQAETAYRADHTQQVESEAADRRDGDAMCVQGYCHHWVGVTQIGERNTYEMAVTSLPLVRDRDDALTSAPANELLRPPQA